MVWGSAQFYIWYKHGEIGMNGLVGFGVLVGILFVSGLLHLKAAQSQSVNNRKPEETNSVASASAIPGLSVSPAILDGRILIPLSPQQLCGFFKTGITAQATRLVEPYLGKWIVVSGKISDVRHEKDRTSIVSLHGAKEPLIIMYFSASWYERVSTLGKSDQIKAIGKLSRLDPFSISLKDCELT
jgi:hypothetical protein